MADPTETCHSILTMSPTAMMVETTLNDATQASPTRIGLHELPLEILTQIASHLDPSDMVVPSADAHPEYVPRHDQGSTGLYQSLGRNRIVLSRDRRCPVQSLKAAKRSMAALLNLAVTNSKLSVACSEVLYRKPTVIDTFSNHLSRFLSTVVGPKAHLQPLIKEMSVEYHGGTMWGLPGTPRWDAEIKGLLYAGLPNLTTLRSLDICELPETHPRLREWYVLLPRLPALERLVLRHLRDVEDGFPQLPRVREAHFYNCCSWGLVPHDSAAVLRRLPSLRELVNFESFEQAAEDVFAPYEDSLETLAWVPARRSPLRRSEGALRRLRRVRHLTLGGAYDFLRAGASRPEFDNFAASVETLEFELPCGSEEYASLRHTAAGPLRRMVGEIEKRCRGSWGRLSVVDLRCFMHVGHFALDAGLWGEAREVFAEARAAFEALGVTLLHDEFSEVRDDERQFGFYTSEEEYEDDVPL